MISQFLNVCSPNRNCSRRNATEISRHIVPFSCRGDASIREAIHASEMKSCSKSNPRKEDTYIIVVFRNMTDYWVEIKIVFLRFQKNDMLTQVKADPEPRAEQEAAKASWLLPAAFSDFSRLSSHKKTSH